jgi:hydroxymethylbilane synthase
MTNKLIIATRESKLALFQANLIKQLLEKRHRNLAVELLGLTTKGDQVLDRPLADIGGKGLFLKELQQALLDGRADIAVHSAKDVPVEDIPGLAYVAFCQRDDVRDVFVSQHYPSFTELPTGAVVGTSSFRRQAQLLMHRPDLHIKSVRGNVQTRLDKLHRGEYDAIILAAAGLKRLNLTEHITEYFETDFMLPAVGQAALMIEARANDQQTKRYLKCLNQPAVQRQLTAERMFTLTLQGNCHSPIGVYANLINEKIELSGLVASHDGQQVLRAKNIGYASKAAKLGVQLAEQLLKLGARKLLDGAVQ